jgi:hypothetical protein
VVHAERTSIAGPSFVSHLDAARLVAAGNNHGDASGLLARVEGARVYAWNQASRTDAIGWIGVDAGGRTDSRNGSRSKPSGEEAEGEKQDAR